MGDYWEDQKKTASLKEWMDLLSGSIICGCDHGCNGWIANNGGKAYKVIEALQKGAKPEELDVIVQKHTDDVNYSLLENAIKEAKANFTLKPKT